MSKTYISIDLNNADKKEMPNIISIEYSGAMYVREDSL